MPPIKKRPVTYGKLPLNRLEPYIPDSASSTSLSSSSVQLTRPSLLPNNPSSPSPSQSEGERSDMQRKRRKFTGDGTQPDHPHLQINPDAPVGGIAEELVLRDNKHLLSKISRQECDRDNSDVSRSPRSDATLDRPVHRAPSSYWRSARRQKPTSHSREIDDRRVEDSLDTPRKSDSTSIRKRLVDSLGTTDKRSRHPTSEFDDSTFESTHIFHDSPVEEADSDSANRRSTRESSRPGLYNIRHRQGNSTTPVPSMLRSSRVTYSRQRSFLNDTFSLTDSDAHAMGGSSEFETKEPHHIIDSRIADDDDDDNGDEANNSKPVRSIHELRQAGDNARFREIIDSIFEDIEDIYNSTSGRCCSLAELCGKLVDTQFTRRFCEQGFDERLVNCTPNSLDKASASLALITYKLIITGGQASRIFIESSWTRILDLAYSLLNTEADLFALTRDPSMGLSKTAQVSIRSIRSQLLSVMDAPSTCLSPRLLALECTRSSLIVLRENGHTASPIPPSLLGRLVDLLAVKVPEDLNQPLPKDQSHLLELVFSILENYIVISGPLDSDHCRCFRRLSQLRGIFTTDLHDQSRSILMPYIRVILNLTNKEPKLCDSFANPELVSALVRIVTGVPCETSKGRHTTESSALNATILALGTLINLVEKTEQSRAIFIQPDDSMPPFLQQLLEQFSGSVGSMDQAHSVPEVHANVVAGYLSILLLTICLDQEARFLVQKSLDGNGLAMVLSTAEKFLQYHREVEQDTRLFDTWEEEESRLTARLEHIIGRIRRPEGFANELL
ncbi:wings apart-like protein regulation of heterochromatin-domain-containing protein [Aspergillus cavernicola]|uniref:Wings apart-like protein regulation of heterochromatin-domain-containing protein n=1 Tax=Aspergillus cavernicola TaxID=176166 RepID=A0ABR4HD00_9EURO